ncbi:hypothetical protein DFH06DRAFT_1223468 [Mycena polygramma]|nr:hypothetical protein DFH06DRAFT_1223468 [Mycena polygramma]
MTTDINLSAPPPDYDSHSVSQAPKDEKNSTSQPSGAYIYYRVYTLDGAIPSKSAFDQTNPFIGRILARSVPPPHNVSSLKRCIATAEGLLDPAGLRTALHARQTAHSPMWNGTKVTILGDDTDAGKTPQTAFVLAIIEELTVDEAAAVEAIDISHNLASCEYLYYRLYTRTAEDFSKVCFDPNEPSVGRIERFRISPPLGPISVKRCIAKAEGRPIYAYAELYEDMSADREMTDLDNTTSTIVEGTAGSAKERPMVLVQPERRAGLFNRPFKIIDRKRFYNGVLNSPVGAVGRTDGTVIVRDSSGSYRGRVYECIMADGKRGYEQLETMKFIDE